jgi:hypothetical protein
MTRMTQRSPEETARRQWLTHIAISTAIFFFDLIRVLITLYGYGTIFTILSFTIFLILLIMMMTATYLFLRGVMIVVNKMGATAKATKKAVTSATGTGANSGEAPKASAIDLFLQKVSKLAYFMGTFLTIGIISFMYYIFFGGRDNYKLYNFVLIVPYTCFLIAGVGQMMFAIQTVMKKVNDAKEKARLQSGSAAASTGISGMMSSFANKTFRKGASTKAGGAVSGVGSMVSTNQSGVSGVSMVSTKSSVDDLKSTLASTMEKPEAI